MDPRKPSVKTGQAPWSLMFLPNHCKCLAGAPVMQKPFFRFCPATPKGRLLESLSMCFQTPAYINSQLLCSSAGMALSPVIFLPPFFLLQPSMYFQDPAMSLLGFCFAGLSGLSSFHLPSKGIAVSCITLYFCRSF